MSIPAYEALYLGTANLLAVEELRNEATKALVTTATVTCEYVLNAAGAQLPSSAGIALEYNAGAQYAATYQGVLPAAAMVGLAEGDVLYIHYKAVLNDLTTRWRRPAKARYLNT